MSINNNSLAKMASIKVIIQARMGSLRFPGKSMFKINGKPSLEHLIDGLLSKINRDHIIIATSLAPENDAIEFFCKKKQIQFYRGDEHNVASRFYEIINKSTDDAFARISADSPLFDVNTLVDAIEMYKQADAEIITTVNSGKYPSGMSVEIVARETFEKNYPLFSDQKDLEHVTHFFYSNKNRFRIKTLDKGIDNAELYKFSFDTPEDLLQLERIFSVLQKPHYTYSLTEKCNIFKQLFLND